MSIGGMGVRRGTRVAWRARRLAQRQGRGRDSATQSRGRPAGPTGLGNARGAPGWATEGCREGSLQEPAWAGRGAQGRGGEGWERDLAEASGGPLAGIDDMCLRMGELG